VGCPYTLPPLRMYALGLLVTRNSSNSTSQNPETAPSCRCAANVHHRGQDAFFGHETLTETARDGSISMRWTPLLPAAYEMILGTRKVCTADVADLCNIRQQISN
jgi:hypothetical protein